MSYCLNPNCRKPENPDGNKFCISCGSKLLLADRYRATKTIGQGGFGKTFLAVDEYKPSHPPCVIKQFLPQTNSPASAQKAAELFQREAQQLDELGRHDQIPELYAHFAQEQQQYLVQEFIDGENLEKELAANGAFNEQQIRQLLQDLLPVLQFVHEQGVIHRDIKPENILRRRVDGKLVLVDFGSAKNFSNKATNKVGTTIGSAGYVAPEQLLGKATPASDLYSLGVTCVRLLTQIAPLQLYDYREGVWVWRDYLQYPVSDRLSALLEKLLQTKLEKRYQSVAQVQEAFREVTAASIPPQSDAIATASPSLWTRLLGATPQMLKGKLAQHWGKYDDAIASYDRAIAIQPNNYQAWYQKGCLCAELGKQEVALFCYEKTVSIHPAHFEAWRERGLLLTKTQLYQEAVSCYLKSLQINNHQPEVWLWLSFALKQINDTNQARICLEKAKDILPSSPVEAANLLMQAWQKIIE
ncbi:MAG TPA: protein kinase [Oscillatoriaceae cyanobacterium M33_DOE_052]|uniref:non-specific serine/threonine protein kinase n=1 Tax=Planktothricoides sp. SpSt-374 TaxID=2282167 RepID=A0A7C3ZK41_9CYAN|nr:protein kinase [Oscillatoriaceae cyanobacterium M33_DOE_052]